MENQVERIGRELSSSDKVTIIQHLQAFIKKGKLPRGAYKQAAEQLNMNPRTVGRVWRTFCSRGTTVSNKARKVGPKPMYSTDRVQQLVQAVPADQRSTFSDMAAATGLTLGTMSRHLKKGVLQRCLTRKMIRTENDVICNTLEGFDRLNYEKLENVFLSFQAVMRLVLEHSGDNHFALPHLKKAALRRAGLLMSNRKYKDMRRLLEQHWSDLTHKYPSILGPAPTALAKPVHGSATATATTRSSALTLPAFRDGATATDKRPPYPGEPKAKTPWRICVATVCPQASTRRTPVRSFPGRSTRTRCVKTLCFCQDRLPSHLANYPQVVAVDALKAAVANATTKATGMVEEPGHPSSTPFAKATHPATHQATLPAAVEATPAWDKAVIPATPVSTTAIIATINTTVAHFVGRPPAITVPQATGTATPAGTFAKTAGIFCDDSGANQDDRRYRSRSHSMYDVWRHRSRSRSAQPADQGYAQPASNLQRSQSRRPSRSSTPDGHHLHVIGRGTVRLEVAGTNDYTLVVYLQDILYITSQICASICFPWVVHYTWIDIKSSPSPHRSGL
ncbi:hypothetical protein DYB37_009234 [Aphanomyces astaci]|uniref:Uncharacterized protein n=1 Tax=Aphanomyces astaci TaxID=112090 RepID=A0A3R6Y3I7_APHAT|nr:hypothetical protein DYB37_009234 [Aphanomyces astaci]